MTSTTSGGLIRKGMLPDPRPNAAVNSLYDPTDAPAGAFTGLLRQFAALCGQGVGPGEWDTLSRWYGQRCLEAWQRFAPNLTEDAFIDWATFSPLDISRKMVNMVDGDWMMGEVSLANMLDQRPAPRTWPVPHPDRRAVHGGLHPASARLHHLRPGLQRVAGDRRGPGHRPVVEADLTTTPEVVLVDGDRVGDGHDAGRPARVEPPRLRFAPPTALWPVAGRLHRGGPRRVGDALVPVRCRRDSRWSRPRLTGGGGSVVEHGEHLQWTHEPRAAWRAGDLRVQRLAKSPLATAAASFVLSVPRRSTRTPVGRSTFTTCRANIAGRGPSSARPRRRTRPARTDLAGASR